MSFIDIQKKTYLVLVFKKEENDMESIIKLCEFPKLKLFREIFADTPKVISCLNVSDDQHFMAVGCEDGFLIFYNVIGENVQHEMYEKF